MSDNDSDSGPEDRNQPASKKPKLSSTSKDKKSDKEGVFKIASKRFVSISDFKGKTRVDIREFYEDSNMELKPGKKGISLSMEEWNKLLELSKTINEYISKNN